MAIRVACSYRTVSTAAILVVAGITPVHLVAWGRGEIRRLTLTGMIPQATKVAIGEKIWKWWQDEWDDNQEVGAWTKRLVPYIRPLVNRGHGDVGYHLAQFLTGHGCFQQYLFRFARVVGPECVSCGHQGDYAEHAFFDCDRWYRRRRELEVDMGQDLKPEKVIHYMLSSRENWRKISKYVTLILGTKEQEERV